MAYICVEKRAPRLALNHYSVPERAAPEYWSYRPSLFSIPSRHHDTNTRERKYDNNNI